MMGRTPYPTDNITSLSNGIKGNEIYQLFQVWEISNLYITMTISHLEMIGTYQNLPNYVIRAFFTRK
jgi:hypothetical protein